MNFWNELSKTVSDAADKTAKNAERFSDTAKLKYRLSSLRAKRNEAYQTLGQLRYAEMKGETVSEDMYRPLCEEITELSEKIKICEASLRDLRGEFPCQRCGKPVKKEQRFCPHCGERIHLTSPQRKAES